MGFFQSTYYSRLFREFKKLEENAYREVVHFFEQNESAIRQLDFEEFFELFTAYVIALFEIGEYRQHLLLVDGIIETAIQHNIHDLRGEELFTSMLFRKSAALYQLRQFDEAEHILRELLKMDPRSTQAGSLLKKCWRDHHPQGRSRARASGILLLLLATFVTAIELLLVRPFYGLYLEQFMLGRNLLYLFAILTMLGGEAYHRWRAHCAVQQFIKTIAPGTPSPPQ